MSRWRVSHFLHSYDFLFALQFSFFSSISDVSGLAGFARLCAGDQYEVRNTIPSMQTGISASHPLDHISCVFVTLGPNALRAATLEATRPGGSQQQADVGQWGIHLSAARHGAAVNQGNEISWFSCFVFVGKVLLTQPIFVHWFLLKM